MKDWDASNGVEPLPPSMPDPLEPVNRGIGMVNTGLLLGVVHPAAQAYTTVVPKPARKSITNFSRNITYPGRLVNHSLQGNWKSAGDESLRFVTNTTVGVAGLFDVASRWHIAKANTSTGDTLNKWGWKPHLFLMLPGLGPSDLPSAVGSAGDSLMNPLNYGDDSFGVYSGLLGFNSMSEHTGSLVMLIRSDADPYSTSKLLWSQASVLDEPDWTLHSKPDMGCLETLAGATLKTSDPKFPDHADRRKVMIPSTGKKMEYLLWKQKSAAPLAYIATGIGSSAYSNTTMAMADQLYQLGYSVVAVNSVFHPHFIQSASTSALPGYPPADCRDLHVAFSEIDRQLSQKYPGAFSQRALIGMSMGGFETMRIAAHEYQQDESLIHFDRFVTVNAPVNLLTGMKAIDRYHQAMTVVPLEQRRDRIHNVFAKTAHIFKEGKPPAGVIPFSQEETQYLIGLSFRLLLRDTIYASQKQHSLGVLKTPLNDWNRQAAYDEIKYFSFQDYYQKFVYPYYGQQGRGKGDLDREANLRTYGPKLTKQGKLRVITNANDFLLNADDVAWLHQTFGSKRLQILPKGGHLGNLDQPAMKEALRKALQ